MLAEGRDRRCGPLPIGRVEQLGRRPPDLLVEVHCQPGRQLGIGGAQNQLVVEKNQAGPRRQLRDRTRLEVRERAAHPEFIGSRTAGLQTRFPKFGAKGPLSWGPQGPGCATLGPMGPPPTSHYQRLGVQPGASIELLRTAFRRRARELHPDLRPDQGEDLDLEMAAVNEAWAVLRDPARRARYDLSLQPTAQTHAAAAQPKSRREAWIGGMRAQIWRFGTQAGRSAAQTLAVRHPGLPRSEYTKLMDPIVEHLVADTTDRVRAARAAGAAPLDLGLGATLLGLRSHADRLERQSSVYGRSPELILQAEMVDRMWDTLAHEITHELAAGLGGPPGARRRVL